MTDMVQSVLGSTTNSVETARSLVPADGFVTPSALQIIENSPSIVVYVDRDFRYLFANKAYFEWFNISRENLIGHTIYEVHKERYSKNMQAQLNKALDGEVVNYELRTRHHSGQLRWVYATYVPDVNDNGEVVGIYAYIRDVNDRKKEQETRAFLQLALDQGMEGFSLHDEEGMYTYVNASEAEMYGYEIDELIGCHWSVAYGPEEVHYIETVCLPVLTRDGRWRGELLGRRKDGSSFNAEVSLTLLTDKLNNPAGLVCNCRDITEKKKNEQSLRQAATVFESTAEGVVITDNQFRIIATNPVYTTLTGFPEADMIGKEERQLYALEQSDLTIDAVRKTLESAGKWQGEIYHKKRDGQAFPTWQTISPVIDKEGNIKSYVLVLDDISQLKKSQERLYHMAHYDYLTGLPNRVLLNQRLEQSLQKAEVSGYQVAVLFLDLDNFKHFNDTLGHAFGDKLLTAVAHKIVDACRDDDVIARVSGDEFVVIAQHVKHSSMVEGLADKLLETFSKPLFIDGQEFYQGVSIGISIYPDDGGTVDELMKHADAAMYNAKEEGKQTFRFYHQSMSEFAIQHVNLDSQLRKALDQSQFLLHYQPLVCCRSMEVLGLEALIRWQHPEWGLTYPDKFIPYAEGSNLISRIGDWVLAEACRQAKQWLDEGFQFECVAVNASGGQLRKGFVDKVRQILQQTGLPPEKLELEITETYLMTDLSQPKEILQGLSDLGVSIAIDDFGVGYSSLSRLKDLPIQRLKIDRSFIADIAEDPNDWSIVQAIIAMSQSLGLSVTAEGVETLEHYNLLAPYDNLSAQGYYFAKPTSPENLSKLIESIHQKKMT